MLDVLDATLNLTARLRDDLAVLDCQLRGELLLVLFQECPEPEHDARALRRWRGPPRRKRRFRSLNCCVDIGSSGKRDSPDLLSRGWISDGKRLGRRGFAPGSAQIVLNHLVAALECLTAGGQK